MKNDPDTYLKYRKNIEGSISAGFGVYYKNTPQSVAAQQVRITICGHWAFAMRN